MQKQLQHVADFHKAFSVEDAITPGLLTPDQSKLRHELMREENDEYLEACEKGDMVGIADALGDQLYILCGTILKHGLQHKIEEVFDEIQSSNMSKLGPDGKPILREDGKILKGPGYFKPNIYGIIYNGENNSNP
jgi:predicted HAD superfamily Cof-like phosphohydrolase